MEYQNFNNAFGQVYQQLGTVKEELANDSDAEDEYKVQSSLFSAAPQNRAPAKKVAQT